MNTLTQQVIVNLQGQGNLKSELQQAAKQAEKTEESISSIGKAKADSGSFQAQAKYLQDMRRSIDSLKSQRDFLRTKEGVASLREQVRLEREIANIRRVNSLTLREQLSSFGNRAAVGFGAGLGLIGSTASTYNPLGTEQFEYAIKDLMAVIGMEFAPVVRDATQWVRELADEILNMEKPTKQAIADYIILGTAIAGTVVGLRLLIGTFATLREGAVLAGAALSLIHRNLGKIALLGGAGLIANELLPEGVKKQIGNIWDGFADAFDALSHRFSKQGQKEFQENTKKEQDRIERIFNSDPNRPKTDREKMRQQFMDALDPFGEKQGPKLQNQRLAPLKRFEDMRGPLTAEEQIQFMELKNINPEKYRELQSAFPGSSESDFQRIRKSIMENVPQTGGVKNLSTLPRESGTELLDTFPREVIREPARGTGKGAGNVGVKQAITKEGIGKEVAFGTEKERVDGRLSSYGFAPRPASYMDASGYLKAMQLDIFKAPRIAEKKPEERAADGIAEMNKNLLAILKTVEGGMREINNQPNAIGPFQPLQMSDRGTAKP